MDRLDSPFLIDIDGLSSDRILSSAAVHLPSEPPPPVPEPKEPTVEERLKAMEEKVNGQNGQQQQEDTWASTEWWNRDTSPPPVAPATPQQQQQSQDPQSGLIIPGLREVPKTVEDFNRAVTQGVVNVLSQAGQQQQAFQSRVSAMRQKFLSNQQYAPWYPAAEKHFTQLVESGVDRDTAGRKTVEYVNHMHNSGFKPPAASPQNGMGIPNPNAGYGFSPQNGQFRPDENPQTRIPFYSDEQRVKDRDDWIDRQRRAHEYAKTKGAFGEPLMVSNHDKQ